MTTYTIGQLAKAAGVHVETIRYYERRGILPEPPRRISGYRQYSPESVARIRFIKRAQELGFSLNEIADLLSLRLDSDTVCSDARQRTQAKLQEIEQKLQSLQHMHQTLTRLLDSCDLKEFTNACPILDVLAGQDTRTVRPSVPDAAAGRTGQMAERTSATLTCPQCGIAQQVEMPVDACQYFYQCLHCQAVLRPKPHDCCVFCSYADMRCPPKQLAAQANSA